MFILVTVLVFLVLLVWWWRMPSGYEVRRQQSIQVDVKEAYRYMADFSRWNEWSPWQLHDPETKNELFRPTDVGGYYTWDSALIGSGRMTHVAQGPEESPRRLDMLIEFFKPFSSRADVSFYLAEKEAGTTEVTWLMHARLPWFLRPTCGMMTRMIGMDFEMGLALLAARLDPHFAGPHLEFVGVVERADQRVLVQRYEGSLASISRVMQNAYSTLMVQAGSAINGTPLAAYWRVNIKKNTTVCDIAVPVDSSVSAATIVLAGGKYFQVRYRGPYRYMPHAWHNAMGHLRMKKLRFNKRRAALEVYTSKANAEGDAKGQMTDLFLPI